MQQRGVWFVMLKNVLSVSYSESKVDSFYWRVFSWKWKKNTTRSVGQGLETETLLGWRQSSKWECVFFFLLLRRCTVWRSWESRWRRWILTEEPSPWVILWAALELVRWWRCSTSSDAEGEGSSQLRFIFYHDTKDDCLKVDFSDWSSLVFSWLQGLRRRVHVHRDWDGSCCCLWIPRTVGAQIKTVIKSPFQTWG